MVCQEKDLSEEVVGYGTEEHEILKAFEANPLAWGYFYFQHHFRGPSPPFHLKIVRESLIHDLLAIAAPRESAKSTIVNFLLPIHAICFKKRNFIVIIQATYKKAASSLETIKKEFRENRKLLGDYHITIRRDAEGDAIFKHSDGYEIQVLCAGREQIPDLRGRKFGAYRPDLVIIDDVEDDEMVKNPERRFEMQRYFDDVVMLIGERNKVQLIMIGTILHDDSQMAKMVSLREYKEFRKLLYRGLNDIDGKKISLWEYKWTVNELERMAKDNPVKFAKEIQNDPSTGLLQDIMREDFRYWYIEEGQFVLLNENGVVSSRFDPHTCKAAIACDLAWEEKRENDYCVIMPAFLTPQSDILIDSYICEKGVKPDKLEEIIFTMEARLRKLTKSPVPIGFEKAKLEKVMKHLLRLAMRKRNQALWFKDLEWDKDKIQRIITRLQPRYKQHMIFHRKGMGDLENQLIRVRSAAHDDLADAEQGIVQLLEYPKAKVKQHEEEDAFNWWRKKAIQRITPPAKKDFVFGRRQSGFKIPSEEGYNLK